MFLLQRTRSSGTTLSTKTSTITTACYTIIISKKRSTVDVVGNTFTSKHTFNSSCNQDVSSSPFISSLSDFINVPSTTQDVTVVNQDVTVFNQDVTVFNPDAINIGQNALNQIVFVNDGDSGQDELPEIISMIKKKEFDKSALMFFDGTINGYHARILVDCGASHNFISEDFIKHHHLHTNPVTSVSVTVANGLTVYINQALMNFQLQLSDFNDKIPLAYVFPIKSDADYDVILGLPWLFQNNPSIDWKARTIIINKNLKQYLIKTINSNTSPPDINTTDVVGNTDYFFINAKQLSRCRQIYLVTIKLTSNYSIDTSTSPNQHIHQLFPRL